MDGIIIELQYLPLIDYFISIIASQNVFLDLNSPYVKQSFRNRAYILGANKIESLSIPILHTGGKKAELSSVKIDYSQNWCKNHLKSIRSAYGKAPYFDYYFDYFEKIYLTKFEKLSELNIELLTLCLKFLNLNNISIFTPKEEISNTFGKVLDLKNKIHPKKDIYNQDIISEMSYYQLFGNKFVPNLSIIDLLFNEGTNSNKVITNALSKGKKFERLTL